MYDIKNKKVMKLKQGFGKCIFILLIFSISLSPYFFNMEKGFSLSENKTYAESIPGVNAGNTNASTVKGSEGYNNLGSIKSDNFLLAPLVGLLRLEGILIAMSVDLIAWTFTPDFLNLLNNPGIYSGWTAVRDFLNIFFIFFLLYSAFCTVFQISRYHIRSTWVMIVVMALLVNFSWPITRVMIDVSNLTMIHIIGVGENSSNSPEEATNSLMSQFATESEFLSLMLGGQNISTKKTTVSGNSGNWWADNSYLWQRFVKNNKEDVATVGGSDGFFTVLIFAIIIGFVFLITFLSAALLLIMRIIILAVLLIFASVGFTLAAFPSTRSYASQWWNALMKQLIVGPILLFCLVIAAMTLREFNLNIPSSVNSVVSGTTQMLLNFIVTIILIWSGIILSSKVGAEGSGIAFGFANKAAAWGRNTLKRGSIGSAKFIGRQADSRTGGHVAGTVAGLRQRASNVKSGFDKKYQSQIDEKKARVLMAGTGADGIRGKITGYGGDKNAEQNLQNKKIAEMKKKWKDDNVDVNQLADKVTTAKGAELHALIEAISEKKDGVDEQAIRKMAARVNDSGVGSPDLIKSVNKKAAETGNAHVAYDERLNKLGNDNATREQVTREIYGGMDAKTYARQRATIVRAAKEHNAPGSDPDYAYVEDDLRTKLNRASFARDMQNADTETYINLENINGTYL